MPLERVTSELVDAADARRAPRGGAVVADEDEDRAEGREGAVVLEISVRRGEGAGRREGEIDVDGELSVERARLLARVP